MFLIKTFANHYEGLVEPFRIVGNVYFVGTTPASSPLIDTGEGLILIDAGYSDTFFLRVGSVYKLGFLPMTSSISSIPISTATTRRRKETTCGKRGRACFSMIPSGAPFWSIAANG